MGLIFDIKEFALNDGSGIRTTVFFKGCPLRCTWCHNPEGLSPRRELYIKQKGCTHCGLCRKPCSHPDCQGLGRCLHICPKNLVSVAGAEWDADRLAQQLLKQADIYRETGGGVTLSGGEPLMQWEFACRLLDRLHGRVHTAIETSGYAAEEAFRAVTERCDFAELLRISGEAHTFRAPLIPGITDTGENLSAIRAFVGSDSWEQLPYNTLAPAKYASVGRTFSLAEKQP